VTDVIIAALVDLTLMRQGRYFYCSLEGGHDFMGWGVANLGKEFDNWYCFFIEVGHLVLLFSIGNIVTI
jgi:hypothetical protein